MRIARLVLVTALVYPSLALAQIEPKTPNQSAPPQSTGEVSGPRPMHRVSGRVYVGERAPDFSLWGAHDREVKLSEYRGTWMLLGFADRREELADFINAHGELEAQGVQVLTVCHEKAHALRGFAQREQVQFEILADVTGEIAALYGLYSSEHRTIRPGFLVLDRQGIVRLAFLGQSLPSQQITELVRLTMTGL